MWRAAYTGSRRSRCNADPRKCALAARVAKLRGISPGDVVYGVLPLTPRLVCARFMTISVGAEIRLGGGFFRAKNSIA